MLVILINKHHKENLYKYYSIGFPGWRGVPVKKTCHDFSPKSEYHLGLMTALL